MARTCVKYDGSLTDDEGIGVEVTLLFNSKHGFEPLERLCKALNAHGCYINKTYGLHVHMDSRHLTKRQVKKMGASIGYALPVIKWLVPKSRHDNTYCKLKVSQLRGDRYAAVNLTAFSKYKTIEIRLHQGSINAKKIKNWIELMKFLGQANLKTDIASFQDLIDLGLSDELVEYCESRITELNPEAWPRLMPAESSQWPRITVLTHLQEPRRGFNNASKGWCIMTSKVFPKPYIIMIQDQPYDAWSLHAEDMKIYLPLNYML